MSVRSIAVVAVVGAGVIFLCSCVATNVSEPIQIGDDKYQVNHIGGDTSDIALKAQQFCRSKGFDYAEMNGTYNNDDLTGNHTTFFCMHKGDTITYPPARNNTTICVPGALIVCNTY